MKFIFCLTIIFLLKTTLARGFCTAENLRELNLGNVLEYPFYSINEGERYHLYCKRPYVAIKNNSIVFKITATCTGQQKFLLSAKGCVKACDLSFLSAKGINVSLSKTKILPNKNISPLKLAPPNSKIKVVCKEGYEVEDGVNYFIYHCDKEGENEVFRCKKKNKINFPSSPPVSDIKQEFKPIFKCHTSNITIPNGSLVEKSHPFLEPAEKVRIKCNPRYTATDGVASSKLGDKIVESFKIYCDKNGTGAWKGMRACTKRCNVHTIIDLTQNNGVKVELLNSKGEIMGNLSDKNKIDKAKTRHLYTEIGSTIKISCPDGFVMSSTGKQSYQTICLDGDNFSIGKKTPFCIKNQAYNCQNSNIKITGKIQEEKLKRAETKINSFAPFKCQGDAIQEGEYFKNGGNSKGVPKCIQDSNGLASWSHNTFSCFNGCIADAGKILVLLGKIAIKKEENIKKASVYQPIDEKNIYSYGINEIAVQSAYSIDEGFEGILKFIENPKKPFMIDKSFDEFGVLKNTKFYRYDGKKELSHFGYIINQKSDIYTCSIPQTKPQKVTLNYHLLKLSFGVFLYGNESPKFSKTLKDYLIQSYNKSKSANIFLFWLDYKGEKDRCQKAKHLNSQNSSNDCLEKIMEDYNHNSQYYQANFKEDTHFISPNSLHKKQICREIAKKLIKKPNHENCKGFANMKIHFLDNKKTDFDFQEQVGLTKYSGFSNQTWVEEIKNIFSKNREEFTIRQGDQEAESCRYVWQIPTALENISCEAGQEKFFDSKVWVLNELDEKDKHSFF
jgi:hypothetical protein